MIVHEHVYTVYCDGCRKLLVNNHPVLESPKEFQRSENGAEFAVEQNGWFIEEVGWRIRHYCPTCQNAIKQLKADGKYNPIDGYSRKK